MTAKTPDVFVFDEIYCASSEGQPYVESGYHTKAMHYAYAALEAWFGNRTDAYVAIETVIYYYDRYCKATVPDIFVALGADGNGTRDTWIVSEENGVAPSFVLNFTSPDSFSPYSLDYWDNDGFDSLRKKYARLGVREYWQHEPIGVLPVPALIGERLVDGEYVPIEVHTDESGMLRGRSEVLGLDMCVRPDGEFRLYDPAGDEWLSSHDEALEGRREAEARAETAEARLEDSESENRRLREMLREARKGDAPWP